MNTNTATTHPTLKSLWNIPEIIRLPDLMPPAPEVLHLIRKRIDEYRLEKHALDPHLRDYHERLFGCDQAVCILENRIEEVLNAFPHLRVEKKEAQPGAINQPLATTEDSLGSHFTPTASLTATHSTPLRDPSQNIFAQNPAPGDSALANQRSSGESEVSPGEPEVSPAESAVSPGESCLTSGESVSPQTETIHASDMNDPQDQGPHASSQGLNSNAGDELRQESDHNKPQEPAAGAEEPEEDDEDDEDDEIDLQEYLDDEAIDASLDLQDFLSGQSPLDKLEPKQQQAIIFLRQDYSAEKVAEVIAEPPPFGFGIQTSKASINRFCQRFSAAREERLKSENAKAIQNLLATANDSDDAFQSAIQRVLKARLLAKTAESDPDIQTIGAFIASLTRLRKQALAERKQASAERQQNSP